VEYGYLARYQSEFCSVFGRQKRPGCFTRKIYQWQDKTVLCNLLLRYTETGWRLQSFILAFREVWEKENKPFGFEAEELHLGVLAPVFFFAVGGGDSQCLCQRRIYSILFSDPHPAYDAGLLSFCLSSL